MSFHQLAFRHEGQYLHSDSKLPPDTLPVMYEGQEIAIAVLDFGFYSFYLPDFLGARIDFSDLEAALVYGSPGNGWSTESGPEDELLYIFIASRSELNRQRKTAEVEQILSVPPAVAGG